MKAPVVAEKPTAHPDARRWLLLVYSLPAQPSNFRVRTWRRLQQIGAVAIRQSVYVLPDTPASREDFEWLKAEVTEAGGEADVFIADAIHNWSDDAIVTAFREARREAYAAITTDAAALSRRLGQNRRTKTATIRAARRTAASIAERLRNTEAIDFFASDGKDKAREAVDRLSSLLAPDAHRRGDAASPHAATWQGRLWVTRPRPGVDRMASAWLIRRFIDPHAQFGFVEQVSEASPEAVPFDMYNGQFTHQGDRCTFETLCDFFQVSQSPALTRLAGLVHDLDLKDDKFGAVDAGAVGRVIDGLQRMLSDDRELLSRGMDLFEALHLAYRSETAGSKRAARAPGPLRSKA